MRRESEDNPNPRANVAFMLPPRVYFIDVFKTVFDNLPNAEFVPDFTYGGMQAAHPVGYKTALREKLTRDAVHWRDLEFSDLQPSEFFDKYAVLVAPFYGGLAAKPFNKNKKKALLFYGPANNSRDFGLSSAHFDLLLCPERYAKERLALFSGRVVVLDDAKPEHHERQSDFPVRDVAYLDGMPLTRAAEEITKLLYDESETRDKTLERLVDELEEQLRNEISSEVRFVETEKLQRLEALESMKRLPYFEKLKAVLREYF